MTTIQDWLMSVCVLCLMTCGPALGVTYRLEDLGIPSHDGDSSQAWAINASGQIAGYSAELLGVVQACLWLDDLVLFLDDLPGGDDHSEAYAVNDAGNVVGYSSAATGDRAVLWNRREGVTQNLGDLPGGANWSRAEGINNAGQVVGASGAATGTRAFLWSAGGGMINLGDLPGGEDHSEAYDINDAGQVVGYSGAVTGDRAFLWSAGGGMINLGDLPGGVNESKAYAINAAGQVVGRSGAAAGDHAFLWQDGVMIDLGELPGGDDFSTAEDINAGGQVVGWSDVGAVDHAFVWDSAHGMQDLNNLVDASGAGWIIRVANGINDAGQVVGYGTAPDGAIHGFLLTPNPGLPCCAIGFPLVVLPCLGGLLLVGGVGGQKKWVRRRGVESS